MYLAYNNVANYWIQTINLSICVYIKLCINNYLTLLRRRDSGSGLLVTVPMHHGAHRRRHLAAVDGSGRTKVEALESRSAAEASGQVPQSKYQSQLCFYRLASVN